MTARHLDYFFKYLFRVERACGIVRVDNYDALGSVGDFFLDVVNVGVPFVLLITDIVNGISACKRYRSCPQGVVGGGDKYFITVVKESLH